MGCMYDTRMSTKQRLSASVDAELLAVAQAAVREGQVESVSAWINDALRLKADHDRRLQALDDFLAGYEAEHGEITQAEMQDAGRRARTGAVVVRGKPTASPSHQRRRRGGAA